MPQIINKTEPVRLVVALLFFLLAGPFVLGVVSTVLSIVLTPWHQTMDEHIRTGIAMTGLWFFLAPFPPGWKLTLIPTAMAAVVFWAGVTAAARFAPVLFKMRVVAMLSAMVIGAGASVIAWQIVALVFEHSLISPSKVYIIGMHVVPTGAILGMLLLLMRKPEPNSPLERAGPQAAGPSL